MNELGLIKKYTNRQGPRVLIIRMHTQHMVRDDQMHLRPEKQNKIIAPYATLLKSQTHGERCLYDSLQHSKLTKNGPKCTAEYNDVQNKLHLKYRHEQCAERSQSKDSGTDVHTPSHRVHVLQQSRQLCLKQEPPPGLCFVRTERWPPRNMMAPPYARCRDKYEINNDKH